jgi:hypothetical protein
MSYMPPGFEDPWPGDDPRIRKLGEYEEVRDAVESQIAREPEWVQKVIRSSTHVFSFIFFAGVTSVLGVGAVAVCIKLVRWAVG